MKPTIDDLPLVLVSRLRASGAITADMRTAFIRFDGSDVEYGVGLLLHVFPNGGSWSRFRCPKCGGGAQRLRLLGDTPACGKCVRACGLRYRTEMMSHSSKRVTLTAPKRIARLSSNNPLRVHRPDRGIERRANLEAKLKRSFIVARRHGVAEFEKRVKDR
jgi:hypothetical protein